MDTLPTPQTAEEYIILVRQLAGITDAAMDYVAAHPPTALVSLDRIAQNVETIASLRGDSGIYETTRPQDLATYQSEMYRLEDQLRSRLLSLGYTYPTPRSISETI